MDSRSEQAWLAQWLRASVALEKRRRHELRLLSESDACEASDNLLSLADPSSLPASRRFTSGLVQQQALFHRRHPT
jgi:hypothetical protein